MKMVSIDTWSVREQLCLASSVLRSGDQNWYFFYILKQILNKDNLKQQFWRKGFREPIIKTIC